MNKVKIRYEHAVFLFAYLNQIDLSLDRSRWSTMKDLRIYYSTQIRPEDLVSYFIKHYDFEVNYHNKIYFIKKAFFFSKLRDCLFLNFKKNVFLKKDEILYCFQKLILLDNYLKSDDEIHKLEIEKLRIELTIFTYGILRFKIKNKDIKKVNKIDHFYKNDNLITIPLKDFKPNDFDNF